MTKLFCVFSLLVIFNLQAEESKEERPHHGPKFTSEQESCLTSILGERGKGERPSKEKMEAAFSKCGIEKPSRRPDENQENQNQ